MRNYFERRHALATACVAGALLVASCKKEEPKPTGPVAVVAPLLDAKTLISRVGAEPGGVQHSEGAAAMIAASTGTIEVRRLGEESFVAIRNGALHSGDQVRVAADASATIVFADTTNAEIAELSTLAIGSRSATADPASSAAVLSGVVRFSVAPRVPGEGPFLVFTPAGIVATKGTVFAVGVAASAEARVGVESGSVEVVGAAALAQPVTLEVNSAIDLQATGELGTKRAWTSDDWGAWRDGADAAHDVKSLAILHGNALVALGPELLASHDALLSLGKEVAELEREAALAARDDDGDRYRKALAAAGAAIDASFLAALRTEWLTHAYASRATIASELYVRHPKGAAWENFGSNLDAAVLFPKRLEAAAVALLEPLRLAYYVHTPRGRAHAQFVGLTVPAFFAHVTPPEPPAAKAKLKFESYAPPTPVATSNAHGVWIAAPRVGWHAQLRPQPAALRSGSAFWTRPKKLRGQVLLGAAIRAERPTAFERRVPIPRAQLKSASKLALGAEIALTPPHLGAARTARGYRITGGSAAARAAVDAATDEAGAASAANRAAEIDADAEGKLRARAEAKREAALAPKAAGDAEAKRDAKRARDAAREAKAKRAEARARRKAAAEARSARARADGDAEEAAGEAEAESESELELATPEPRVGGELKGSAKGSAQLSLDL